MLACERDRVWLCCPALVEESVKSAQLCWRKTGKRGCCEGIFLSDWRKKKGKAISEWMFLLKLMTKKKCNWWLFQIKSFHVALRREGGGSFPLFPPLHLFHSDAWWGDKTCLKGCLSWEAFSTADSCSCLRLSALLKSWRSGFRVAAWCRSPLSNCVGAGSLTLAFGRIAATKL